MLPSCPMSKWFSILLLVCATAHAAPDSATAHSIASHASVTPATLVSAAADASANISVNFSAGLSASATNTTATPSTSTPTSASATATIASNLAGGEYAVAVTQATQAARNTGSEALARFMQEKNQLLAQLEQMSQGMVSHTSDLVFTAMGFLGVPYRRGGNSAETGFDCSGFVRSMYERSVGLILPRKASDQAQAAETIDHKDLQPGDLVFFNTMRRAFSHVGIYIGDGKFIHSPRSGSEVRVEDMADSYWKRRFNGARRVTLEALAAH